MTQNDRKVSASEAISAPGSARGWLAVSAFAVAAPLTALPANAQDYQVTRTQSGDDSTWTYREIPSINYGIKNLPMGGAPGNNCPVPAFEVVNPRQGEFRCVGYITRW